MAKTETDFHLTVSLYYEVLEQRFQFGILNVYQCILFDPLKNSISGNILIFVWKSDFTYREGEAYEKRFLPSFVHSPSGWSNIPSWIWSWEPRASFWASVCLQGPRALGHLLLLLQSVSKKLDRKYEPMPLRDAGASRCRIKLTLSPHACCLSRHLSCSSHVYIKCWEIIEQ